MKNLKVLLISIMFVFSIAICFLLGACGGNSEPQKLDTPVVTLEDDVANWNEVPNASRFEISINGNLEYLDSNITRKRLEHAQSFKVRAIGDGTQYSDSDWSNLVTYEKLNTYNILWLNGNVVMESNKAVEGELPVYNGAVPTKEPTAQYSYVFSGWSPAIAPATQSMTYVAVFESKLNSYDITWKNGDTILEVDKAVPYGEMPQYNGDTPKKSATVQYKYTFNGWSPRVEAVTKEITYEATFEESLVTYTFVWKNGDEILYVNENVEYGSEPEYKGATPTKEGEGAKFEFNGWKLQFNLVTQSFEFIALFDATPENYDTKTEYLKAGEDRLKLYDGKTFKILATTWGGDLSKPGAPWGQAELTISPSDINDDTKMNGGFGRIINTSLIERENLIKEVYGIEIQWFNAKANKISNILATNLNNPEGEKYHLAMPRMLEAQSLVENQMLVNIAEENSLDLSKSYYNQMARESYSVAGNTYFVAGDFSFLDESTAYIIFYNLAFSDKVGNLYSKVKNGTWTIEEMINAAKLVGADNGDESTGTWADDDTYGFGTTSLSKFFQSSGIQQVTVVQPVTSDPTSREYAISLNDTKVPELINHLLAINKSTWARNNWTGGYNAMQTAFVNNRLLFYNETVQKLDYFSEEQTPNLKLGILPMPKLNENQKSYHSTMSYMSCLACIPKTTNQMAMAKYVLDILSWTGQEYVMGYTVEENENGEMVKKLNGKGYYGYLSERVSDYREEGDSMDILINDITDNLIYDVGYVDGWSGLLTSVQNDAYSSGENKFQYAYMVAYETANQTVAKWNKNWKK